MFGVPGIEIHIHFLSFLLRLCVLDLGEEVFIHKGPSKQAPGDSLFG